MQTKLFYAVTENQHHALQAGNDETHGRGVFQKKVGKREVIAVFRIATGDDIAYVRSIGGGVPKNG